VESRGHILVVDDERAIRRLLRLYLTDAGFTVTEAPDGEAAIEQVRQGGIDLVLLDLMLPGMDGYEVCKRVREIGSVPVIMVTARTDEANRITGLELGADDYVPKPCTPRELTARIRAILKRVGAAATAGEPAIIAGTLTVWPAQRRAERAGKALNLTSTEFNLVEVLARNAGRPVSKADLSQEALGRPLTRFDRSIDVHMSSIRHKLGKLDDGRSCIQTVIRKGYQLIAKESS
jgi:two-component system OmpR family response regulator/two-component system response regulator CpxR